MLSCAKLAAALTKAQIITCLERKLLIKAQTYVCLHSCLRIFSVKDAHWASCIEACGALHDSIGEMCAP